MIPSTVLGLLLFVFAVAPGYAWVRVAERHELRVERSPLLEAAELVILGLVATFVSAVAVIGAATWVGWLPDLQVLAAPGSAFFVEQVHRVVGVGVTILTLSYLGTWTAARIRFRGSDPALRPASSVWRDVFARASRESNVWVSARLVDGRTVEGYLHSFPTNGGTDITDIALRGPLRVVLSDDTKTRLKVTNAHYAIVRADQISEMWVRFDTWSAAS